ncbi:MAG: hypothetical protein M1434_08380 [Chloroflexi bacterium]|nr:hypothetical protein [Chloroflexota bacterium]MCL5274745.1 hypothetical protein [Chloroflexota bacterium]
MNNLAYGTQSPEKVAPQIEEKLRKELGSPSNIPYQVEDAGAAGASVGTVLGDMAKGLFGGHADLLFTVVFDISTPFPAQLRASVSRQGVGCHVGLLLYTTQMSKPVKSEVTFEAAKLFGSAKFSGDPEIISRLNAKGEIAKRIGKFSRTESEVGGLTIKTERVAKLMPQDGGALLVISTLPRMTSMGMDASLDAREFMDIAALVRQTL